MNSKTWQEFKDWSDKVKRKMRMHRVRPTVSRSSDMTRLTNADIRNIAKESGIDIRRIRWNAKKRKLKVDGKTVYEGPPAMLKTQNFSKGTI